MKTASALLASFALGLLAFTSSSCSTTNAVGSEIPANESVIIERGMPVADLIAVLGEPNEVRDVDPPREGFAIWTYTKSKQDADLKVTGYKETPYYNPITGVYSPIQDPVSNLELTTTVRVTEFLIGEGVVLSWKDETKSTRRYND